MDNSNSRQFPNCLDYFFSLLLSWFRGYLKQSTPLQTEKIIYNWGWNLAGGIIDLLIGILLLANPGLSVVFLLFYVGFALIFRAIMTIGWAVYLNKLGFRNWGWVLFAGIIGLLFSFLLLWNPAITGLVIVIYLSVAFIMLGTAQIILSLRLKQLNKKEN